MIYSVSAGLVTSEPSHASTEVEIPGAVHGLLRVCALADLA